MSEIVMAVAKDAEKGPLSFPIPIDRVGTPRDVAHSEATHRRHITCLILCLIRHDGQTQLLVMNKHPRNILKSPGEQFPPHCLDTCGGHFVLSQRAKLDGVLDADGAAGEALRELNSEVKGPNEFMPEDLVYLGSLTYDDPKNRELRLVYGVRLTGKAEDYVMQDDILTPEGTYQYIKLPCEAHAYRELLRILHNAPKDTMIHDGLGQLLECVRLPESVESKVGLRLD